MDSFGELKEKKHDYIESRRRKVEGVFVSEITLEFTHNELLVEDK